MKSKQLTKHEYFERSVERFWSKVDRSGPYDCWMWQGTIALPNKCGQRYGSFGISEGKSVNYRAHRFAWMLCNGRIPEGMVIMHSCDVPLCVNPAHLKLGTQADNVADRDIKGRTAKGENHGHSKLTETQARFIKHSTERPGVLGKRYGVHPTAITAIRTGKNWAHLAGLPIPGVSE